MLPWGSFWHYEHAGWTGGTAGLVSKPGVLHDSYPGGCHSALHLVSPKK